MVAQRGELRGEPVTRSLSYGGERVGQLSLGPRTPGERVLHARAATVRRHRPAGGHRRARRASDRRSAALARAARHGARGGAPAPAPRPARRPRPDARRRSSLQLRRRALAAARDPTAADAAAGRARGRDAQPRSPTSAGSSTSCARPRSTSSGLVRRARAMQAERVPGDLERARARPTTPIAALPAAVEVAAYRIATEATDERRRATPGARSARCTLGLQRQRSSSRSRDDGAGMPHGCAPGVGLASMRERAAELGGTCDDRERAPAAARACAPACPLPSSERRAAPRADRRRPPGLPRGACARCSTPSDASRSSARPSNGDEAVAAAVALQPDVVVMDLHMPELNGIEATRQIVAAQPARRRPRAHACSRTTTRSSRRCAPAPAATCSRARAQDEIARAIRGGRPRRGDLRPDDRPARDRVLHAPRPSTPRARSPS